MRNRSVCIESGQRFGRLEVILELSPLPRTDGRKNRMFLLKCDCGSSKIVQMNSLRTGNTRSCGCISRSHGMSGTRTHQIWKNMKNRCYNKKVRSYSTYGAKGIEVCESWKNSFKNFLDDMGVCPDGMSLERVDVGQGYDKSNCEWIPKEEQAWNKANSKIWIVDGVEYPSAYVASSELNVDRQTIVNWCKAGKKGCSWRDRYV